MSSYEFLFKPYGLGLPVSNERSRVKKIYYFGIKSRATIYTFHMVRFEKNPLTVSSPESESHFLHIDRKSPEILSALENASLFKKYIEVHARPAIVGEEVETRLEDGRYETVNIGKEGQWVITNPAGERYISSGDTFLRRYVPAGVEGMWKPAEAYIRAIKNPYGKPIELMAQWGQLQNGDEQCWLADVCDREGKSDGEPYIIGNKEFLQTYIEG